MRSVLVAVAPVFQPRCVHCSQESALENRVGLLRHICSKCGVPQPIVILEDYFSAFGLPRRFRLDLVDLEKKFYSFSRAFHPDRFS